MKEALSMNGNTITIKTKVNKKIFRDFAVFDTLIRQKRWRAPLFFACMMLVFAAICFTQTGRIEGAPLLGGVLAGVGILLPAAYFFSFYSSIQAESRKQKLIVPQHVYTVTLSACQEGIIMTPAAGKGSRHRICWENAHAAYRVKDCIYLFISPRQAFLLPDGQADVPQDEVWKMITEMLPGEKCYDRRH